MIPDHFTKFIDDRSLFWQRMFTAMTKFSVQFTLPVDNPVNNVRCKAKNGKFSFEVPLNHPDAHTMGLLQLLEASKYLEKPRDIHKT